MLEQIINKKQCSNTKMNLRTLLRSSHPISERFQKRNWQVRNELGNRALKSDAKKLEYASIASEQELSYEVEQWLKVRYKVIYYTKGKLLLVDISYHIFFYYTNGIL
jgi:hypothetical protein